MQRFVAAMFGAGLILCEPHVAHACGGCFQPPVPPSHPERESVITDHRMVLSVSTAETTLWDQIKYAGNPDDFVWVLPVADASTLRIGLADNNFVNALDAFSAPVINGVSSCRPANSGGGASIGCGSGSFASLPPGSGSESVRVMRDGEAVVGPYEVAIVSTENGGMPLDTWLETHGLEIPAATRTIVDYYVGLQFDFIILRLRPGAGVQEMQPVRVTTRGYAPSLPLRMVAAGVGEKVGLTLMVIGTTRMTAQAFGNEEIAESDLTWDFTAMRSNYNDVFSHLVHLNNGRTWVTESAQSIIGSVLTYQIGNPTVGIPRADAGYDSMVSLDASDVFDANLNAWLDASTDDAYQIGDSASMDAHTTDGGSPTMEMDDAGVMHPADPFIDRTTAFHGFTDQRAVITRLRTELVAADLATDLILDGSDAPLVSNQYLARGTFGTCPQPSYTCAVAGTGAPVALEGFAVVLAVLQIRRWRRRRSEKNVS